MQVRVILLVVLALASGLGTVKLAQSWLEGQRSSMQASVPGEVVEEAESAFVLVADADLPAGRILQEQDLRWQAWPEEGVAESYAVKGEQQMEAFLGAVLRSRTVAGEPIAAARVVKPGDRGFLAAVLTPGARAVSVPVNATSGIAGLVFPGDRVDVILTLSMRRDDGAGDLRRASETVLRDIRVLAVDQSIDDQADTPKLAKTATLEVTGEQAEMLNVMLELGTLSLSLRSLGDPEASPGEGPAVAAAGRAEPAAPTFTLDSDVSQVLRDLRAGTPAPAAPAAPGEAKPAVKVVRGSAVRIAEK